ncbi:hypothetical protein J2T20_001643 [Paenibacillus wynnii]|nr:hypothetical protein [Paenibacillus wynnii]
MSWSTYLYKEIDNEDEVIYKFTPNLSDHEDLMGKIKLNKITNMISELEPYKGDTEASEFYYNQACYCLANCYKNKEYPDKVSRHI